MHSFADIAGRSTRFALAALQEVEDEILAELEHSGATRLVKGLQMVKLSRLTLAVGVLGTLEAFAKNEFGETWEKLIKQYLDQTENIGLRQRYFDYYNAINVLKHGRGPSYKKLLGRRDALPFRIKGSDEAFFDEGDVSEINALIDVDVAFVEACLETACEIYRALEQMRNYDDWP